MTTEQAMHAGQHEDGAEAHGLRYAGVHLLVEIWGGKGLDDLPRTETAMREAVAACGATLLDLKLHRFQPQGITGVAMLSESHLTIHSWPETGYAAVDVFTCGSCDPYRAIPALRAAFDPTKLQVTEQKRGISIQ